MTISQVKKLDSIEALTAYTAALGIDLPLVDRVSGTGSLSRRLTITDGGAGDLVVGNRWSILPMEGWDAEADGRPSELVHRRWRRFGSSGAKLIWGGEAVAVVPEGRANPRQVTYDVDRTEAFAALRSDLLAAHAEAGFDTEDLVVGLQLTHSGRWSRPVAEPAPRTMYTHPVLDSRVGADAGSVLSDDELHHITDRYVAAAGVAADAGFAFVDVKACHGYLLHESLTAFDRTGPFGGDFAGRTRLLLGIIDRIRSEHPNLGIGVRLSAIDDLPHQMGDDGVGVADPAATFRLAFGRNDDTGDIDLDEPNQLLVELRRRGVGMVCVTVGSPYYNPHIQRPAFFPPSDGYHPPEDPLVGVVRQLDVTRRLAEAHPEMAIVGSGYSYLQQWLPNVGEAVVASGGAASIGLGRMVLSYPHLPADVAAERELERRLICRTFSDCTTAPRNGLVSGCYPLDPFYKALPERKTLTIAKREAEANRGGRRR
ncbi:MAG: NADH:flavin oxidoreductase [Acidimicrobiales bacterium]